MANSLTDYEVSVIKNLLENPDFNNQEIAGLINRYRGDAKSDVSSGRISNIKNNQIQKYISIEACNDQVAKAFLDKVEALKLVGIGADQGPLSDTQLSQIFPIKTSDSSKLNITETDQIECKESFNIVMKTVASFANNKGGYFAFGVKDKTWQILGLNSSKLKKFEEFDLKNINQLIRAALGADLQVQKRTYVLGEKVIGVMYIAEAKIKPLIFAKSDSKAGYAEGHIYYRYPGEDRMIAPLDLQKIIEDRIRDLSKTILKKHISQILDMGPANAAILNTSTGEVEGAAGNFIIDEALLSQISFVREGQFVEKSGAPTLKLLGELKPTSFINTKTKLGNITNHDLITAFLNQKTIDNPEEFIKRLRYTQTKWLPIFYFKYLANLDTAEAVALIQEGTGGMKNSIASQTERLEQKKSPPMNGHGTTSFKNLMMAQSDIDLSILDKKKKTVLLRTIQELKPDEVDKEYLLNLLQKFYPAEFEDTNNDNYKSQIRSAISSVDAMLFKDI